MHRLFLPCTLLFGVASAAVAPAAGQEAPDLRRSDVEFGFTGASGNTSFSILSAAASLGRVEQELDMSNSLSTTLLANLSLVINHSYIHDEVPPPGAEPDDQRLSVVLRVSL